ncbi:DUF305 domain-containing protein [Sporichthya brevicatena]|uniref:DUF305 domain-containing protein n=1 Tax=Sporichthya brevicatena TaxID=171442 RepID=A0ABN1H977_9ACTN
MKRPSAPVAVAAGALVLGLGAGIGLATALDDDSGTAVSAAAATPSAVDIGFSQDMIVHHEQAVLMAQLVRGRTADPKIAALAAGIESDQLLEIGTLRGYLALWDAPVLPAGPPMTWMADHQHGAAMPGMATTAQLNRLRSAKGAALDRMFLQLMLRHHEGGQPMLSDAAANAAIPAVRALASRMSFHQGEEIRTIQALLATTQPS